MGADYLSDDEGGTLTIEVAVEGGNSRSTQRTTVTVPPNAKVYMDVQMEGDVRER